MTALRAVRESEAPVCCNVLEVQIAHYFQNCRECSSCHRIVEVVVACLCRQCCCVKGPIC